MSFSLDRKKILCVIFFLLCVLPACFAWFRSGDETYSGLSQLELPLLIGTTLYALGLLFDRIRYILPLGILSHLLLLGFSVYAFFAFPVNAGISPEYAFSVSIDHTTAVFWVSLTLQLTDLALFTTTELAVRKLARSKAAGH